MLSLNIEETQLKNILKSALIEIFEERRDLLVDIAEELLEQKQPTEMDTTEYLLSNPANARRLLTSLENARSGKVFAKDLIDA
jgi:PHD/YefM family antitoxin component YafN of YafNO toxin-antitoxin module